jgi:TolA-binding protein
MKFLRKPFLLLLLLGAGLAYGQTTDSKDVQKQFSVAERSFQDGLYDVARSKLQEFLTANPKSPSVPQARWLLGQCLYFNAQYAKALDIFKSPPANLPPDLAAGYPFWEAETLLALNRSKEAITAYEKWLPQWPKDPLAPQARLGLARAYLAEGRDDDGLALLKQLHKDGLDNPFAQKAALAEIRFLLGNKKQDEAAALLKELIRQKPKPPIIFETSYWNGELALQRGEIDAAQASYASITGDPRASPRELVARAWFGLGQTFAKKKDWKQASDAFEKAFTSTQDAGTIEPAVTLYLKAAQEGRNLTAAALKVRDYAAKTKNPIGLYAIGRFYYDDKNYDAAILELDGMAKAYPDSPWSGPARLLVAESLLQKGARDDAIVLLAKLADDKADTNTARTARQRLAEIRFQGGDFEGAAADYAAVAEQNPDAEQAEDSLYQTLVAYARAGKLDPFLKSEKVFSTRFPNSKLKAAVAYEKAGLLESSGKSADARDLYQSLAADTSPDNRAAQASLQIGLSYYRDGNYAEAAKALGEFESKFKDDPARDEADYWRLLAELLGQSRPIDEIRADLQKLADKTQGTPLGAKASFQIAQTYFDQQNFAEAQKRFEQVASKYASMPVADVSLYLEGRSAMALNNIPEAITILEKIPNDSPVKIDARLAQMRAYMIQGKHEAALSIADSILANLQDSPAWVEATLRKANCLYTLAETGSNADFYQKALAAAQAVIDSKSASVTQRNEAGFLKGKTLEKLNKPDAALEAYLDVVYGRLFDPAQGTPAQPEYYWFIRCGWEAGRMKEEQDDIKGAVAIYRIMERLGGPNRRKFREKIEDLKSKHFIWEESTAIRPVSANYSAS